MPSRVRQAPAYLADYELTVDFRRREYRSGPVSEGGRRSADSNDDSREGRLSKSRKEMIQSTVLQSIRKRMTAKKPIREFKRFSTVNCLERSEYNTFVRGTLEYSFGKQKPRNIVHNSIRAIMSLKKFTDVFGDEATRSIARTGMKCCLKYPVILMYNQKDKSMYVQMKYETRDRDGKEIDQYVIGSAEEKRAVASMLKGNKAPVVPVLIDCQVTRRISDQYEFVPVQ